MPLARLIHLLLILQFALATVVTCRCASHGGADSWATADLLDAKARAGCCGHDVCPLRLTDESPSAGGSEAAASCARTPRKSCPGRLLPDLAPPPSACGDELLALLGSMPSPAAILSHDDDARVSRGSNVPVEQIAARSPAGEESLLRLHCALIV